MDFKYASTIENAKISFKADLFRTTHCLMPELFSINSRMQLLVFMTLNSSAATSCVWTSVNIKLNITQLPQNNNK